MTKGIAQLRYYGNKHANNWPQKSSASAFTSGSAFEEYYPITDLKIYSNIKDLSFKINGSSNNIIIQWDEVLQNGSFKLNNPDNLYIYQLSIDRMINNISSEQYLIIDIIYEKEGNFNHGKLC